MKRAYVYEMVEVCNPRSGNYHTSGGLLIITSGYPNDAVPVGTGNPFVVVTGGVEETKYGLPEPTVSFVVPDDTPDRVIVFPDAGCC